MKILCITHASFEKPGAIATWAENKKHTLVEVAPYDGESLSDELNFDLLVIMGGPQSPLETDKYPYLSDEIAFARKAIKANKCVWGTCLGAQIIAEALGAKTLRSENKEIGMYPVEVLAEAKHDPVFSQFGNSFNAIHWHNDMPGIPEGGTLLAKSKGCSRQAFVWGDRVYGFQFHLEPTRELIEGMIENCPDDLKSGTYVRTKDELRGSEFDEMNKHMFKMLDYFEKINAKENAPVLSE